ncbi:alginate O-acetyltransferase AlgX-related protein [Chryseobacterium sp. Mn2064]|uniref:alginate O-acetyltransferase AlgX-related protein n=1 Tax=Chryseobacterium sp. Mn2064 TaxID=3395263 RepID=UPI003BD7B8FD
MKRFILKTAFFVAPFLILYIITYSFSIADAGDLLRLGYLPSTDKNYRQKFTSFNHAIKFTELSKLKEKGKNYKILTIGDSFSEQGPSGYQNILANDFSVLHVDRFISNNQIQKLIELCNGNFFDTYKVQYVVLQCVERNLSNNLQNIDNKTRITTQQIDSIIIHHKPQKEQDGYDFFSRTTLRFPYSALKYFTDKNYLANGQVYNFDLNTTSLFSNHSNKLLFYYDDLMYTPKNNLPESTIKLNQILNNLSEKLKEKNITLIFLPSPDKYDLYYNYIVDKQNLIQPKFFDHFEKLHKEFIYINSKEILTQELSRKKDIYYFDDTHWSPIAASLIAQQIKEAIVSHEQSMNAQQHPHLSTK